MTVCHLFFSVFTIISRKTLIPWRFYGGYFGVTLKIKAHFPYFFSYLVGQEKKLDPFAFRTRGDPPVKDFAHCRVNMSSCYVTRKPFKEWRDGGTTLSAFFSPFQMDLGVKVPAEWSGCDSVALLSARRRLVFTTRPSWYRESCRLFLAHVCKCFRRGPQQQKDRLLCSCAHWPACVLSCVVDTCSGSERASQLSRGKAWPVSTAASIPAPISPEWGRGESVATAWDLLLSFLLMTFRRIHTYDSFIFSLI